LSETNFCPGEIMDNPVPDIPGGIFSVDGGLAVDPVTGAINLSSAVPGNDYEITYTLIGDCPAQTSQTISISEEAEASFDLAETACAGDQVQLNYTGSDWVGSNNFLWDFNGAQVISGSGPGPYTLQYNTLGLFSVALAFDGLDCTSGTFDDNIDIINLELTTNSEIQLNYGESVNLNTTINSNNDIAYQWSPATGLSCSDCPSPIATPQQSSVYQLSATDVTTGCTTTASIAITVEFSEPYVPNVFSPNEDTFNDVFKPEGAVDGLIEFSVYNRLEWNL